MCVGRLNNGDLGSVVLRRGFIRGNIDAKCGGEADAQNGDSSNGHKVPQRLKRVEATIRRTVEITGDGRGIREKTRKRATRTPVHFMVPRICSGDTSVTTANVNPILSGAMQDSKCLQPRRRIRAFNQCESVCDSVVSASQLRRISNRYASIKNKLAMSAIMRTVVGAASVHSANLLSANEVQYPAIRNKPAATNGTLAAFPG